MKQWQAWATPSVHHDDLRRRCDELGALRVGPRLLQPGAHGGSLVGASTVVKDLFDVVGERTGAGNPDYLDDVRMPTESAFAVQSLVDAGATVIGKSHTDELAFSLSGTNVHYGTPLNPRAPGRMPGGSSSGSAAAVSGGLVSFALGSDTAGSTRVPASYCGIVGFRPTHGRIARTGMVALAPSFDTVGVLAADGITLQAVARVLLHVRPASVDPAQGRLPSAIVIAEDLMAFTDPQVGAACTRAAVALAARLGIPVRRAIIAGSELQHWAAAFISRQQAEAWQSHGQWITSRRPRLGPGIAERFWLARAGSAAASAATAGVMARVRQTLETALAGNAVLALPAAAGVAPLLDLGPHAKAVVRRANMHLNCVAGLAGAPAISLPLAEVDGLPVGLCLVARPRHDEVLLAAAAVA